MSRDPMDDFEIRMHALGQVEDVLRLLLRTFRDEGYSVDDVATMVRVCLERIEHEGVSDVRFTGLSREKRETLPAAIYLALSSLASP